MAQTSIKCPESEWGTVILPALARKASFGTMKSPSMTQNELQTLQQEWLQVKQKLDRLHAEEDSGEADSAELEASLQLRLDELEFEIALRQRGSGPCSLM